MSEGVKYDQGKARLELIPPEVMVALGEILTMGAAKYGDRNWEQGMSWGRVFGAAMRHLWAWWGGKGPTYVSFLTGNFDEESQYSHLWHALACVAFLVTYEMRTNVGSIAIGTDDRHGEFMPDEEEETEYSVYP